MRKSTFLIFALLIGVTISACAPGPTPQTSQEPAAEVFPVIPETLLPFQEENPDPTESPPATQTATPKPTQTTETLNSTAIVEDPSATNTAVPSETSTFEPTEIFQGNFYGVDENHLGVGKAIIIQTQIGEYSLHLENFEVTSGPGLHVILAEENNPYNIATLGDYLDLGELKSTKDDQSYALPNDVNLEKYGSVVVYCVPFQAIFAIAPIR